jgi:thermospermine synthase
MGEAVEIFLSNGFSTFYEKKDQNIINNNITNNNNINNNNDSSWYEEVIDEDLKWSFALNRFVKLNYLLIN